MIRTTAVVPCAQGCALVSTASEYLTRGTDQSIRVEQVFHEDVVALLLFMPARGAST